MQSGTEEPLSPQTDQTLHEYLSYMALVEAADAFECWLLKFEQEPHAASADRSTSILASSAHPVDPSAGNFTMRLAREQKLREYELEKERWQEQLQIFTEVCHFFENLYLKSLSLSTF